MMPVMAGGNLDLKPKMTIERTKMHKNIKIVKIDSTLKNVTPYWIIIAAGSVEEGKLATFKYIDSSTNLTEEEKLELKKFVKELWKKYRVKTINDGDVTLITLDSREVMTCTLGLNLDNGYSSGCITHMKIMLRVTGIQVTTLNLLLRTTGITTQPVI